MERLAVVWTVPEPLATRVQQVRVECAEPNAQTIGPHVTVIPPTTVVEEDLPVLQQLLHTVGSATSAVTLHLRGAGTFRPLSALDKVLIVDRLDLARRDPDRVWRSVGTLALTVP